MKNTEEVQLYVLAQLQKGMRVKFCRSEKYQEDPTYKGGIYKTSGMMGDVMTIFCEQGWAYGIDYFDAVATAKENNLMLPTYKHEKP